MAVVPASGSIVAAVHALEVLDCRGVPTVEVEIRLRSGARGRAIVPSGVSRGPHEAPELRDGEHRFRGLGVRRAVRQLRGEVDGALRGLDVRNQPTVDRTLVELDGTPDRHRLGANTMLGASLACAQAAAAFDGVELWRRLAADAHLLPVPMLTLLDGGVHARGGIDVQELLVVPWAAESFADALRIAVGVHWALGDLLAERGDALAVGDTGGYAPRLPSLSAALDLVEEAIERAGHHIGEDVAIAIDAAAGQWRTADGSYRLTRQELTFTADELVEYWTTLASRYPIAAIEDPFAEEDRASWATLTARIGAATEVVGDEIFATRAARVEAGVQDHVANTVLVKPNQVGTLTETLDAVTAARSAGLAVIMAHRSGETEDTTIADLAVGLRAAQIKAGGPDRGERIAKYNRLLRIEDAMGDDALYAGREPFVSRRALGDDPTRAFGGV